jgi:hypothetical protein
LGRVPLTFGRQFYEIDCQIIFCGRAPRHTCIQKVVHAPKIAMDRARPPGARASGSARPTVAREDCDRRCPTGRQVGTAGYSQQLPPLAIIRDCAPMSTCVVLVRRGQVAGHGTPDSADTPGSHFHPTGSRHAARQFTTAAGGEGGELTARPRMSKGLSALQKAIRA